MQTIEGIRRVSIRTPAVTLSCIQSMVVVTSPIGDQAPPAFAATMIIPANHILSSLSLIIFLKIVMSTMVAVRLSMIADNMKARIQTIHRSLDFFLVLIIDLKV